MLIHGYPDNAAVWAGVIAQLRARYRLISYDVRGAGASGKPSIVAAYRFEHLQQDFVAVLDAVVADQSVHLLAHDWGSIQAWHFAAQAELMPRIASFTSVSGPGLDYAGHWLAAGLRSRNRRKLTPVLRQLAHSYYIAGFKIPRAPELLWRAGALDRAVRVTAPDAAGAGGTTPYLRSTEDALCGLNLYRANIGRRRPAAPKSCGVAVQVLAPDRDRFVTAAFQTQAPAPYVADLKTQIVPGGHWIIAERPEVIARCTAEFIDGVSGR
ncbi:hypothetical protein BH10ACT8_BH10ACT8_19110 [soil metagenome]